MGESKLRRLTFAQLLREHTQCVYCGDRSATIEHFPPKMMFTNKDRPAGLEFPCCDACNRAASFNDTVSAMLGRCYPTKKVPGDLADITKLFAAIGRNEPDLLLEMKIPTGSAKLSAKRAGISDGYALAIGPRVRGHMLRYAARMGFAFYFDATRRVLGPDAKVRAVFFPNAMAARGTIPPAFFESLPGWRTLKMGRKEVSDQFEYAWMINPGGTEFYAAATYRYSFASVALVDVEGGILESDEPESLFRPGFLRPSAASLPLTRRV